MPACSSGLPAPLALFRLCDIIRLLQLPGKTPRHARLVASMQGHNHRRYGDSFERLRAAVNFEDYDYPSFSSNEWDPLYGNVCRTSASQRLLSGIGLLRYRFRHRPASLLPIPMPRPKQHGITPPSKPVDVRWEVEPMVTGVPVRVDSRLLRGHERAHGYPAAYRRGRADGPSPHDIQHVQGKEGKHISPTREASSPMKTKTSTPA